MKILVTGAAGFIGSNLVKTLQENNYVYGFDNFLTGVPENINNLNVKMVESIKDLEVDKIFHLGMPSASPIYRDNRKSITDAFDITIKVLELAKKNNAKLVYASTSSIYNGNEPPYKEEMPIKVTDFYTEVRYSIERIAKVYNMFYGLNSVGLRFFSVYGPHDAGKKNFANTVTQFALDVLNDRQPVVYGDGEQTRDLVHVEDVVAALLKASEHGKTDVFNVGTGKAYSFNQIIQYINEIFGKDIKPKYIENPLKNYVALTLADTTKAENVLGFKTKYDFKEGLTKYLNSEFKR